MKLTDENGNEYDFEVGPGNTMEGTLTPIPKQQFIPAGEPCEVWNDNRPDIVILQYSCGDGMFVPFKGLAREDATGMKWDHARPARFPSWDTVRAEYQYLAITEKEGRRSWFPYKYEPTVGEAGVIYVEARP
jgi:hypothetical protein